MSRLLRIDTSKQTYSFDSMGDYEGLGGRALSSRLVSREVPPTCHPLGAKNKLVLATGMVSGRPAGSSGRLSVGAKSPLTGGIKESNVGGTFAQRLARLDLMGVVLEGKPAADSAPVTIIIGKNDVTFEDASDLRYLGTYETVKRLMAKHGEKASVLCVGPAGDTCRQNASIQVADPNGRPARAAGRGGMGAVMGSKGVKAVVIVESGTSPNIADKEAFKAAAKRWVEIIKGHPVTAEALPNLGTAVLVNILNEAGGLPTKNFRSGRFDNAGEISGEKIAELIKARGGEVKEGCHAGCIIQCSQAFHDKQGKYLTSGFEYETVWAFGSNILVKDIDDIAMLDHLCDDLGLDTIETGNAMAMAMEAGLVAWGDGKGAIELLKSVYDPKNAMGRIMGGGANYVAQAYGIDRVPVVKNQAMPAYDPRAVKGVGITYATTPMGADHTAGYSVAQNILGVGGSVNPLTKDGQVELSKALQIATAAIDASGFCLFVAFPVLDTPDGVECMANMIQAAYGKPFTVDDFLNLGKTILKDEFAFNAAAGFTAAHDQLPEFMAESLPPHNVNWDFTTEEMQSVKDL
ncbi:aldehyde ferredoxin oxidoreductase family protein [Fundidesulfovibrio soli]|uniref:aldehyde ferredoxin oxidoreductase family protein n=1 Tax=Fundidesulfovibrio soli TaxID=2922716 RepID=UPI001FAEB033|nr:aldehyde ferredoxin oxidoreductase C-terminal domain-containing protein [Fundidesulfovibrio soli]